MCACVACVGACVRAWVRAFVRGRVVTAGAAPSESKLRSLNLPHELVCSLSLSSLVLRSRYDRDGCPGGRGRVQMSAASAGCAWSGGAPLCLCEHDSARLGWWMFWGHNTRVWEKGRHVLVMAGFVGCPG